MAKNILKVKIWVNMVSKTVLPWQHVIPLTRIVFRIFLPNYFNIKKVLESWNQRRHSPPPPPQAE